jgi:branched-chain amino acid transport system ATP-binding protein
MPSSRVDERITSRPILEVDNVSVTFGGVKALDRLSVSAESGRVTGLIGPNGAGKTTMFNVVTGLERPTGGRVLMAGRDVSRLPTFRRARLGLARTFQRLEIFASLNVYDNVLAAAELAAGYAPNAAELHRIVGQIIERVGLGPVAQEPADALPTGQARLVELARALATRPRVLLLDEPASGLNKGETDGLGDVLLDLASEGLAILLVEHDVELVMQICELVYVLDFGRLIASGPPDEIRHNPAVQAAYLGAETPELAAFEDDDIVAGVTR